MHTIGAICVVIALLLELGSYWKQIAKTLRTKKSKDVSTSAYLLKVVKYLFTMAGLTIYANYVGLLMEVVSLAACLIALAIVARFKPRGWKLWK
jgi:uncharacterized protein with PQ loop repeat